MGVAIAATALAGLSFFSVPSFAVTSDDLLKSGTVIAHLDPSLSIAIPIPHQEVWIFAQNGFLAPLPRSSSDGIIPPPPPIGNDVVFHGFNLGCPQWTPSEFEMVLPDFHGRPKPFPRRSPQWPATFVVKGADGSFLQASFLEDGLTFSESEPGAGVVGPNEQAVEIEIGHLEAGKETSLPKALGGFLMGAKFTCFSL